MYSLAVEKRGLIAYDDKRVLLANLENGEPNPYTHAYGHYSLANEIEVHEPEEPPEPGNDLQIITREQRHESRLQRKHELAVRKARHRNPEASSEDEEAELHGADLVNAEQAAAARPGAAIRIQDTIERLLARQNLPRPVSPPPRLPPHIANPQGAGMTFNHNNLI